MVGLQRLGLQTAYAGRFGSECGRTVRTGSHQAEGVDIEFVEVVAGAHNQIAFVIIDARSGERTIIWDRDDRLAYKPEEVPLGLAVKGRVLHLDAHDPPACAHMARTARASGSIVFGGHR